MGTARRRKTRLLLAEFLEALDAHLSALKPAQLRAALMAHAERLPSSERHAFLAIFEPSGGGAGAAKGKQTGRAPKAETLLHAIEAAVGMYGVNDDAGMDEEPWEDEEEAEREAEDEEGWEEGEDEEEWEDDEAEDFAWPMAKIDALFARADAAFRGGNLVLASDAYHRLLHAVANYQEEGLDDHEVTEPVEKTDLSEAKARYLRALYETTDPDQRPAVLLKAMQDLQYVGHEPVGLPELIGARRAALPDRERFLDGWIDLLGRTPPEPTEFDPELRRLLFQAVEIHRGPDGLADLARRDGRRLPEAYRQWVLALVEEDRTSEAIEAAQEALRGLPPTGEIRAWVAEFIAEEAEKQPDGSARLDARREAFRAAPSIARLSALCEAAEPAAQLENVARAEATRLHTLLDQRSRRKSQDAEEGGPQAGDLLLATLHLLSGEADQAISMSERAPAVGWSGGDHPASVVIPYLLVAATGGAEPAPGTALAELWHGIDTSESFFPTWDPGGDEELLDDAEGFVGPGPRWKPRPVRLTPILRDQIQARLPDPDRRERFLTAAWTMAQDRVKAIVESKQRQAYERAAALVAGVAEARVVAGEAQQAHGLLEDIRRRYSRFYAFTGELDKIARRSPLLPSPPSKPRRW